MKAKKLHVPLVLSLLIILTLGASQAQESGALPASAALGTSFTYQGRLAGSSGHPISGPCDLQFGLWNDAAAGSMVAGPVEKLAVPLSDGRFTVELDMGPVFDGSPRWLEIGVRCTGDPGYVTLTPRQSITAAPYALQAANADTVDGLHAGNLARTTYGTLTPEMGSVSIEIPHWTPFTLHLGSGWPDSGGVAIVQGMENDRAVAITFVAYNGNNTTTSGGAECYESQTTTLLTFGNGSYTYSVGCPGESDGAHNLVLTASGVELRYRIEY